MNNCNISIEKLISKYTKYGWFNLTNIFNTTKFAKEKNTKVNVNESVLKLLGDIRLYIIENAFNCNNTNKDTYYVAYGSTNITSDYDITIVGKNASKVMYDMFHSFLQTYNTTLPYTYDSNIYPDGLYLSKSINSHIKQLVKLDNKHHIILPYTDNDYIYSINMACIKLLHMNVDLHTFSNLKKYIDQATILLTSLMKEYDTTLRQMKIKYRNKKYNKDMLELITKVELNYKKSKKLYNILYKKNNPKHIIKYQTQSSFFSIEAYYVSSTIAAVVYEIQAKKKMNLQKRDYICAIIENLGDMVLHIKGEIKHSTKPFKSILLKYSKYMYRIYFCLSKILHQPRIHNLVKKINTEIIPNRKTGNTAHIDFKLLHYTNETPDKYIQKCVNIILTHIDENI